MSGLKHEITIKIDDSVIDENGHVNNVLTSSGCNVAQ